MRILPTRLIRAGLAAALILAAAARADTRIVAREGKGLLADVDGYPVLIARGSPREMGRQHGVLLRDKVRSLVHELFEVQAKREAVEIMGRRVDPVQIIESLFATQKAFIPERFVEEMEGLAEGSGLPRERILAANLLPELFHCSGFAVMGKATKDGTLYHGRVLDYATGWRLQEHAVLLVQEPEGRIPFVNVAYAGFIGSVTGMNAEKVAIGEMGGGGVGFWAGTPMSFLVRRVLEEGRTLDDAIAVFRDAHRTCQYFFVVSDAKTNRAVGMEASWDKFYTVKPNEAHPLLPHPVEDAVILSAGDRYLKLVERIKEAHGRIDAEAARHLMDAPVAMKHNLHDALFEPATGTLWVANAAPGGCEAWKGPYHRFRLGELLRLGRDVASP
ncbi:MAG: peptidase C45 [Planctomycetes bacterium]|nr:peptidase C45 [Planctomycetota bacterium]